METLLQVLADSLVSAYKRRPGAADEVEVQIDPDTMGSDLHASVGHGDLLVLAWFVASAAPGAVASVPV